MQSHAVGFGSLNLDEFWEVDARFLRDHGVIAGQEYVRDVHWFKRAYAALAAQGRRITMDPGGSAANTIAALCRMGFDTGFYGAAGRDDATALRLEELGRSEQLRVHLSDVPSGRCLAVIDREDSTRDRGLVILPNANDMAGSDDPELAFFSRFAWVHLTSFVAPGPLEAQIKLVRALPRNINVSFDPGAVYVPLGLDVLGPIISRAAILFVAREELVALTDESVMERGVARILEIGTRMVVVKMGSRGMRAFTRTESFRQEAIPPRQITDRTGAGDVAAAGLLAGILSSLDLSASLELAARAASASIEGYGRSAYPDRAFLARFLSGRERG